MLHGEEVPGTAQSSQSGRNGSFVHSLSFGVFNSPTAGQGGGPAAGSPRNEKPEEKP